MTLILRQTACTRIGSYLHTNIHLYVAFRNLVRSLKGLRDVYSEVLVKIGDAPTSVNRLILDPFSLLVMSTHPKDISDINRFRKEGLSMRKAIEAVLLERGQGEFIP